MADVAVFYVQLRTCMLALLCGLALLGCDVQSIRELEEGLSTEADVRLRFGEPERIWPEADGARTLEYNRQPEGHRNYMITIGADGKMSALRQVLTPHNFARIQAGMPMSDVRRLLGKPMQTVPFPQKQETHADWRYLDGPNTNDSKIFTVIFDSNSKVIRTFSVRDPSLDKG
ncbi:MAG: outer membrane protein assembly factor BamE [Pseudomonadota bacterium]